MALHVYSPAEPSDKQWARIRELEEQGFSVMHIRIHAGDRYPTIVMRKWTDYRIELQQINPDASLA